MMEAQTSTTLDALVRCRQVVLTRTNDVLTRKPLASARQDSESVQALTGLLMTTLEALKVAEEELRVQNASLAELRAAGEQRAHHYRQIFLHIPAPAIVTDVYATILESNHAADQLLRQEASHLERKPLASLLNPASRPDFRTRLDRLVSSEESRQCVLTFNRRGDTPIDVDATVAFVPDMGPTRSAALFWLLTVRPSSD
jgi:PAS domain S-box-containing protein